jgi:hypothetical protein
VDTLHHDQEADLLERIARYREDYRSSRLAALKEEREQRHAGGELYLDGTWLQARDADLVGRGLQRREILAFFEIAFLLILSVGIALGLCWLFAFLFLPD